VATRIKQYHKEGRALRTETTINNPYDFNIGKRLPLLPRLRQIGFQANRRLLEVEKISHDCMLAEEAFQRLHRPRQVNQQRTSALRFADPQVQSLCHALLAFPQLPGGFSHRHLRERFAALLGKPATALTAGQMTYHLRRLRLHQIIERIAGTHRYRLTDFGLRTALFFTRIYNRLLRPGLGRILPAFSKLSCPLRRAFDKLDREVTTWDQQAQLSAA
jgi:hypothetical protein